MEYKDAKLGMRVMNWDKDSGVIIGFPPIMNYVTVRFDDGKVKVIPLSHVEPE